MPNGAAALVPVVVPMVAADWWGRSAVYNTVGGASILTLPFTSDMDGGLDRADFSLMGDIHGGDRLKAREEIESTTVAGADWDVDGSIGVSRGPID